jgi:PDZ domain-containing protein
MRKSTFLALILLLIPFIIVVPLFLPHHEEFVATGDISTVKELGIDGNVYFTYVHFGVTRNYWEKFAVKFSQSDDITFTPLEDYTYEEYLASEEVVDEYQYETVSNAVSYAGTMSSHGDSIDMNTQIQEILNRSEEYSGDSYGLMIAIGLIEEWQQIDFSQGGKYKIAGTGAMLYDQSVGSIGAVRHKLLTAEKNGVDIFLIPEDKQYFEDPTMSNEYEAEQVVKEEGLSVKVIPVSNLDDAISVLRSLD